MTGLTSGTALRCFYQQHPYVTISRFGNAEPVLIAAAEILAQNKTEVCRIMAGIWKTLEVSGFRDNRKAVWILISMKYSHLLCYNVFDGLPLYAVIPVL